MKRENQRITLTKRLLKDALIALLDQIDLEHINVSILCRHAGINRATFYKHYSSPRDVLLDIEKDIFSFDKSGEPSDFTAATREYLLNVCRCMYSNSAKLKILLRYNTDEDFAALLSEFHRSLWGYRDRIRGMDSLDEDSVRLIATYIVSGACVLLRQWIVEDIPKSPEEITELIMSIISKEPQA